MVILLVAVLGGFWFLLAEFALGYIIFKFRHREGVEGEIYYRHEEKRKKMVALAPQYHLVCDLLIMSLLLRFGTTSSKTCRQLRK